MYACICRGITEADVRRAGGAGITAPDRLIAVLGLDDERCCGRCAVQIEEFVELAREGASRAGLGPADGRQRVPFVSMGALR
jgi:bacterioferritin-associated ferredoxin